MVRSLWVRFGFARGSNDKIIALIYLTQWRYNNRSNPDLFWDTLVKLLGSSNLEYRELIVA